MVIKKDNNYNNKIEIKVEIKVKVKKRARIQFNSIQQKKMDKIRDPILKDHLYMLYKDLLSDKEVINATNAIQDSRLKGLKFHVFKNIPIAGNLEIKMPNSNIRYCKVRFFKDSDYDKISRVVCGYDHLSASINIKVEKSAVLKFTDNGGWFRAKTTDHSQVIKSATTFEFVVYFPFPEFRSVLVPKQFVSGKHKYVFEIIEVEESESETEDESGNGDIEEEVEGKNENENKNENGKEKKDEDEEE